MVHVSQETPEQVDRRLRQVIRSATLHVYPERYAFEEFLLEEFPGRCNSAALAMVRDDQVWSQLVVNEEEGTTQRFRIFRFHFPPDLDNSGFVGWLASHLKNRFGTGVFVTCGQNSGQGGIFDYWGVPEQLGEPVIDVVKAMVAGVAT